MGGLELTITNYWNLPGYQVLRLLVLTFFSHVRPYQFENNLPVQSSYDFIVVGAGAAGSIIATRLSETSATVLLLEEGPSASPESAIPYFFPLLGQSEYVHETRVVSLNRTQQDLPNNADVILWEGRGMGGGTSINGLQFIKGSKEDFDYWADLGNTGWDYDSFLPYYHKSENYEGKVFPGLENLHGKGGPIGFSSKVHNREFMRILGRAAKELGYNVIDPSSPRKIGFSSILMNIKNGLRVSTSEGYLRPNVHRKNLLIKPRASVRKILFDENKRAIGVEYVTAGKRRRVRANKEVILSAGVFNSPKLLMLSGVGPANHLWEMGIELIADVEGVGQNFQDHPMIGKFTYEYKFFKENFYNLLEVLKGLPSYKTTPKSELQELGPEGQSFFNLLDPENKSWPDFSMAFYMMPVLNQFNIHCFLARPKARGLIRLKSKDYKEDLIADPRYLSNQDDVNTLIAGMKFVHEFTSSKSIQEELGLKFNSNVPKRCRAERQFSDSFFECLGRHWITTGYHYCGTCKMAPESDPMGVVSPNLKVRGVEGLRVVDGSIMPQVVTVNVMSTVIAIAEKAADMIKQEYSMI